MLLMSKRSKEALTVLLITFLIFNGFSIRKKFWKAETETFPTIPSNAMYVEGVKSYFDPSTCFNIHSSGWYGWISLSLSFPKLFSDWKSIEYQESYKLKCYEPLQHIFEGPEATLYWVHFQPFRHE